MLHAIRSLESGLRNFIRSLRQSPRHSPRLPFSLTMVDARHLQRTSAKQPLTLTGYTRNVSESGLALIVPKLELADRQLVSSKVRLLIVLELPTGTVRLQATPVRYEWLDKNHFETGHLIGARINEVNSADRPRFFKYLQRLSRGAQLTAKQRRYDQM